MTKHILLVLLITISGNLLAQETEEQIKKIITQDCITYSRAFEFKDYNKITEYFHYPVLYMGEYYADKNKLIEAYVEVREKQIQPGYKYSMVDEIKFIKISNDLVSAEFYYSRFNANYEKIFSGSSLGTYKKLDGEWKMSEYGPRK